MKTYDIDHTALDLIRQGPAKEVKRPITNTQPEIDALTVRLLMDTPFQVKVLRLHCEHLRTLLDRVILEFTTMEHELATDRNPSFATIAPHLSGLDRQSEKIAVESFRLQGFLHSLGPQKTDAAGPAGESPTLPFHLRTPLRWKDIKSFAHWTAENQQLYYMRSM